MNDNIKNTEHREQDPAEGSREIVDRELKRQDNGAGLRAAAGKPAQQGDGDGIPHNEAHEIFDRERQRQDSKAGERAAAGRPADPTPLPLEERPQINQKK